MAVELALTVEQDEGVLEARVEGHDHPAVGVGRQVGPHHRREGPGRRRVAAQLAHDHRRASARKGERGESRAPVEGRRRFAV
jgi:hypothetical protein